MSLCVLKTFVNFLLERREAHHETPVLAQSPEEPLEAVKLATTWCLAVLDDLDSNDQMSLEIYATDAHHEMDLTENYHDVAARLAEMQAGHYNSSTSIGAGLEIAIDELTSNRARPHAKQVIMLMTDGQANVNDLGNHDPTGAAIYALGQAQRAADHGIRIYCISVGVGADRNLMQQIASIGRGEEFYASGDDPVEYTAQLMEIFGRLGGKRPVGLIQ